MKKGCLIGCGAFVLLFGIIIIISTIFAFKNADELGATPNGKLAKELGVETGEAAPILEAFTSTGLEEYTKIEHDELLDNAHFEGEKGFRIKGKDFSNVILYLNADSTVYQIKYADNILYENGKSLAKISDFILTNQQKSQLQIQSQEAIKSILKSPSTAKFPNILEWYIEKVDGVIIIQSYVDSQNSFGATLRADFQIKIQNDEVISLIFDGKEYIQQ